LALDEAHKARGAYAYTTAVKVICTTPARFRLLALSATPGKNAKEVQEVINNLQISLIEVRSDADESVKKYIHEKNDEIIVIPRDSATHDIGRKLNSIINPILDQCKRTGALGNVFCSFDQVSVFHIVQAQAAERQRDGPGRCFQQLAALQSLVGLRVALNGTGIGTARQKLNALLQSGNNMRNGALSKIIKLPDFKAVVEMLDSAQKSSQSSQGNDPLKNNPKLSACVDALEEHFTRHRATKTSSRAIVFSQMRESVNEITKAIGKHKPLLLPSRFIGQGTGSDGAGMKQTEQQDVIGRFRRGEFNILVCTCIAEEGLDIGEVDLVINYDCLASPIRLVQRTGRTGRKRNGRVVSLCMEGSEEEKLERSKQSAGKFSSARAIFFFLAFFS
jgi:Fanconi anemia group M protein